MVKDFSVQRYSLFLKDLFLNHAHAYKRFYFNCNVMISKCIISKENYWLFVADTLSRASLNDSSPKIEDTEIKCYVHAIQSNYLISNYRLQQFQHETKTDEYLQTLLVFVQDDWPQNRDHIPETVHPYTHTGKG